MMLVQASSTASLVLARIRFGMSSFSPASWTKSRISARCRSSAGTLRLNRRVGRTFRFKALPPWISGGRPSPARLRLHPLAGLEHVAPRALVQRVEDQDLLPAPERLLIVARAEGLHPLDVELLDPRVQFGLGRGEAPLDAAAPLAG